MKIIKELAKMIREELDDAEKYAKCAAAWKETDSKTANMFLTLSREELNHAFIEHEQAVRIINESGREAPEAMKAVWEWEHELLIDRAARIKLLQDSKA